MKNWKTNSWRNYPVKHIPEYPDKKELDRVLNKINNFPPLVFAGETRHLKAHHSTLNGTIHVIPTIPLIQIKVHMSSKQRS